MHRLPRFPPACRSGGKRTKEGDGMYRAASMLAIVLGVFMAFIGLWGLITAGDASTAELEEDQLWIGIALLCGGVSIAALALTRLVPRTRD